MHFAPLFRTLVSDDSPVTTNKRYDFIPMVSFGGVNRHPQYDGKDGTRTLALTASPRCLCCCCPDELRRVFCLWLSMFEGTLLGVVV